MLAITFIFITTSLCRQPIRTRLAGKGEATEAPSPKLFMGKVTGTRRRQPTLFPGAVLSVCKLLFGGVYPGPAGAFIFLT